MRHELLMAHLKGRFPLHLCFTLIQKTFQRIAIKLADRLTNRFPQAGGDPRLLFRIELQSGVHDGFIGGSHGVLMACFGR